MMPVPHSVWALGRARAKLDHVLSERNNTVESGSVEDILAAESRASPGKPKLTLAQAWAQIRALWPTD